MGAHRRVIGAEGNMSAPKIRNPEGCRPRTSRISESWHDALVSRQVWVICVESTPSQTCPHYSRKRLYSCAAAHWRFGPTTDMNRPERLWSRGIFVYPPVLHDNLEVLRGVGDQVNILQRVALDQQQIGERALFHDAELPWIRIPLARQCK